jgi:hypothetical protein
MFFLPRFWGLLDFWDFMVFACSRRRFLSDRGITVTDGSSSSSEEDWSS